VNTSVGYHYIFVLVPRKRRRPDPKKYGSILYHYNYWIHYYYMLPDQNPIEVIRTRDPILTFPIRHIDEVEQFAYEIGGTKVAEIKKYLKSINKEISINVVGFEADEKYERHVAFSLLAAVERSKTKLDRLKAEVLMCNIGLLMTFVNVAEEVYKEKRDPKNVLKIGKALKLVLESFKD